MRFVQNVIQLGVLAQVFGFGNSEKIYFDKSPLGPKMCEVACRHTMGCSSYMFLAAELRCQLGSSHVDKDKTKWTLVARNTQTKSDLLACPKGSYIIFNKAKQFACVHRSPVPLTPNDDAETPASETTAITSTTAATTTATTSATTTTATTPTTATPSSTTATITDNIFTLPSTITDTTSATAAKTTATTFTPTATTNATSSTTAATITATTSATAAKTTATTFTKVTATTTTTTPSPTATTSTIPATTTATTSTSATKNTLEEYGMRTRLLFMRRYFKSIYQLHLHNRSLQEYFTLNILPSCLAYMPLSRRIIIGMRDNKGYKLVSYSIYDSHTHILTHVIKSNVEKFCSIAVEENCHLVFLYLKKRNILKMSLDGSEAETTIKTPRNCYGRRTLMIQSHKTLYVSCRDGIYSVLYEGKHVTALIVKQRWPAFTIDHTRNELYYNKKDIMYTMSLKTFLSNRLLRLPATPSEMIYHGNRIYVIQAGYGSRYIGLVYNYSSYRSILSKQGFGFHQMCIVP